MLSKTMLINILKLLRPKHYVKNAFVFAPLLFSANFMILEKVLYSIFAFVIFCCAASAVYVFNDLRDIEKDKLHPLKSKKRPLASGVVSISIAYCLLLLLYVILFASLFFSINFFFVILVYVVLNFAYSIKLKTVPVLDIFTIATGFVLRVVSGAVAIDAPISVWMLVTTLCLALYLASIKRRQELKNVGVSGRDVLNRYSVALVDRYAEMSATGALLFYSMFVMEEKPRMAISIPFVLLGLFRYWYVVEAFDEGESPTDALLADNVLLISVMLWVLVCGWVLWVR